MKKASRLVFGKRKASGKTKAKKAVRKVMKSEVASMKQTISGKPGAFSANIVYGLYNFALSNCDRAVQIAQGYQEYRITKIEVKIKANSDTYSIGTSTARSSVPYLYYLIDKTGTMFYNQINFNSLRDGGAKAIRIDDKTRTIVFKPAVLQQGFDANSGLAPWSSYRISPWLTTNANNMSISNPWTANSTDHLGLSLGLEQEETAAGVASFDMDFVVHYQFRKPRNLSVATGIPNVKVDFDTVATGAPYTYGLLDHQ